MSALATLKGSKMKLRNEDRNKSSSGEFENEWEKQNNLNLIIYAVE